MALTQGIIFQFFQYMNYFNYFKKPAEYWTLDAIASHYCQHDNYFPRILDYIKKDLQRRVKMGDNEAQLAEQLLNSGWNVRTVNKMF